MAVIGTIESWFLAPGVSANNRLYTAEIIEKAYNRLVARLADPEALPVTMLSHHAAGDDSKELCARVVTAELDPQTHRARLHGYLIDTAAGRDIASAIEPGPDGRRVLDAVSIRGWWLGPVRRVEVDGVMCETGDDLEIDGIDFTKSPGVAAARITGTSRTTTESDARTPITESVEVSVMSDSRLVHTTSTPTPAAVPPRPGSPAAQAATEAATETGDATGDDAQTQETETTETTEQARERYDAMLAKVREAHVAVSGWQGPVDIDIDAWGLSNDDVAAAATQLGKAYDAALRVLDPDNDDDLDLPDGDTVGQCPSCNAGLPDGAMFCPACGTSLAAVDDTEAADAADKENTVSEKTPKDDPAGGAPAETTETAPASEAPEGAAAGGAATEDAAEPTPAAVAPTLNAADVDAIATALAAKIAPPAPAATEPAENAPAATTPATEAAAPAPAAGLTEADVAQRVNAAVEAATDTLRKQMLEAYGPPPRRGLVEAAAKVDDPEATPLHKLSPEEFARRAAAAWGPVFTDQ
jgi:uncharacterized Zn finger protein (UPF0148 family)